MPRALSKVPSSALAEVRVLPRLRAVTWRDEGPVVRAVARTERRNTTRTRGQTELEIRERLRAQYPWQGHAERWEDPADGQCLVRVDQVGLTHVPFAPWLRYAQSEAVRNTRSPLLCTPFIPGFGFWACVDAWGRFALSPPEAGFFVAVPPLSPSFKQGSEHVSWDRDWDVLLEQFRRAYEQEKRTNIEVTEETEEETMSIEVRVWIDPKGALKAKKTQFGNVVVSIDDAEFAKFSENEAALLGEIATVDGARPLGRGFGISEDGNTIRVDAETHEDEPITEATVKAVRACLTARLDAAKARREEIKAAKVEQEAADLRALDAIKDEIVHDALEAGVEGMLVLRGTNTWQVIPPVLDVRLLPLIREARAEASKRSGQVSPVTPIRK